METALSPAAAWTLAAALVGASPAAAAPLPAKPAQLFAKLHPRGQAGDARLDGGLGGGPGVYGEALSSGTTIELRADEPFPTASSIKPAVLYELYHQADEKRLDPLELTPPPSPRGCRGGGL